MHFLRSVVGSGVPAAALAFLAMSGARDARACGGCFHPSADTGDSVVTDHRMVFEITAQETILWDQVRYAGDPKEFAWVLPVRAGARIELSRGEWIAALDAATRSTVQGPQVVCPPPTSTGSSGSGSSPRSTSSSSGGGGGGGGCGGGGYSSTAESAPSVGSSGSNGSDGSSSGGTSPTFAGNDDVEVVAQSSIGPYQAVTIRASGGTGITEWLTANGFAIPANITPVIDGYTAQKLDFIALKLRPNQGVQAMRPIRIVSPGADTTLPLRMVAAGVGARVGLTLWVIGEGRYHTQNFPDGIVDWTKLAWDASLQRSNRSELEAAALASNGGRSWITEAAVRTSLTVSRVGSGLPNVHDAYTSQCLSRPPRVVPCDEQALPPADGQPADGGTTIDPDAGAVDDDGGVADGGTSDGGAGDGGDGGVACTKVVSGCDGFDDLDVASRTVHAGDVWVTRLRADLPVSALSTDLQLAATTDQSELSPSHKTSKFTNPTFDPCAGLSSSSGGSVKVTAGSPNGGADGCTCRTAPTSDGVGTWVIIGLTTLVLPLVARRRRRRRDTE